MARNFNPANTENAQHSDATQFALTTAFTIACWFNPTSTGNGSYNTLFTKKNATPYTNYELSLSNAAGANQGTLLYYHANVGGSDLVDSLWVPPVGQWSFACATIATSTSLNIYGGTLGAVTNKKSQTNTTSPATNAGAFCVGFTGYAPAYQYYNGKLAEIAIWKGATLSSDEVINGLGKGVSPLSIRPGSLSFYAPLWGTSGSSNEPDLSGNANTLTLAATSGSPAYASHAPVQLFSRKFWSTFPQTLASNSLLLARRRRYV